MENSARDMNLNESNGIQYLTFKEFEKFENIKHAFSTRIGGVSSGIYESLNLAFGRGDLDENVFENYNLMCDVLDILPESMVFSSQNHGVKIRRVTRYDRGEGVFKERRYQSIDGLITNNKDVTLVTHFADCVPLFFYDPKKIAIGLSHAGWRGTVAKIGALTVKEFVKEFESDPKDIVAAIGPSIGPCCFEVSADVFEKFASLVELRQCKWYAKRPNGKYNINLWEINKQILIYAGIKEENISVARLCTCCFNEIFFSHRATKGQRGGLAAFMSICS